MNKNSKPDKFEWTDEKVVDFVNWYLRVQKISFVHSLENQTLIDSFKQGDKPEVWNGSIIPNVD